MTDAPRLAHLPGLTVSRRAAQEYAAAVGLDPRGDEETARRELHRWLLGARLARSAVDGSPADYRWRSRAAGLDIMARVAEDEGLHVVVSVSVRRYRPRRGGQGRRG